MLPALIIVVLFYRAQTCTANAYCEIEKTLCYHQSHVGCSTSKLGSTNEALKTIDLKFIVEIVNKVRRDYSNLTKIGNMRMVSWDSDLSFLAEQKIIKPESGCLKTYRHSEVYTSSAEFNGNGILKLLHTSKTQFWFPEPENKSSLFLMNPMTTDIGCAAYFKDNVNDEDFSSTRSQPIVLLCLLNGSEKSDYSDLFRPGEPCSACPEMNCFTNLCLNLPISKIKSDNTNPYTIMFTVVIYILLLVVIYLIVTVSIGLYYIPGYLKKDAPRK